MFNFNGLVLEDPRSLSWPPACHSGNRQTYFFLLLSNLRIQQDARRYEEPREDSEEHGAGHFQPLKTMAACACSTSSFNLTHLLILLQVQCIGSKSAFSPSGRAL
jgi:hypothetical protein